MPNRPSSAPNTPAPRQMVRKRRVLVVDDSRTQREILTTQLRQAGYQVTAVADPAQALAVDVADPHDIILSDWMMPIMTGPQFCRAFRSRKRRRYGYFVMLTARNQPHEVAEGLSAGADDFLIKPTTPQELVARLQAGERILRMEEELLNANARLASALSDLRAAQQAMETDLREARKIQQGLVRERHATFGDVALSLLMRPAGHIGGDLVGFRHSADGRIGIYAVDVAGHGITAALLAARLSSYLSGGDLLVPGTHDLLPPAQVAAALNHLMLTEIRTDNYFTLAYAELYPDTGRMLLVQAGHPHPMLQCADGTITAIGNGGLPIGVSDTAVFEEIELTLAPGDRLLIASDGITEAVGPGGAMLGEEGLEAILRTNASLNGPILLESLCWSVSEYGGGRRVDDNSAVLIERAGTRG
ncbi:MAG: fused response regulator/phosphatase [Paracoccus denitrificans]|nr:MAG: fused response regulator/phosphatase [Paracoccus denitrificans]PZO83780.1 MAG: fused response regulator/phosphatase [Paracoccus denitrificans]